MWRCPDCRRQFANRNQSHACGRHTLAHHFAGKPKSVRLIFDKLLALAKKNGPLIVLPEKTRIAFQDDEPIVTGRFRFEDNSRAGDPDRYRFCRNLGRAGIFSGVEKDRAAI